MVVRSWGLAPGLFWGVEGAFQVGLSVSTGYVYTDEVTVLLMTSKLTGIKRQWGLNLWSSFS